MRTLKLIEPLQLSSLGPVAQEEQVHLRQGDADGACGLYCVLMALLLLGLTQRDAATAIYGELDGRTRMGRLWATLPDWGPLVCRGTDDNGLVKILDAFGPMVAKHQPINRGRRSLNRFIIQQLQMDRPVVVGIDSLGGSRHWVLAVGIDVCGQENEADRLLILDPGLDVSPACAWNSVIELSAERNKFPSICWNHRDESRCVIETALAISSRSSGMRAG